MTTFKNIPENHTVWVVYQQPDGTPRFIVTSNSLREEYNLFRIKNETATLLGSAKNPLDLEAKYQVHKKIQEGI